MLNKVKELTHKLDPLFSGLFILLGLINFIAGIYNYQSPGDINESFNKFFKGWPPGYSGLITIVAIIFWVIMLILKRQISKRQSKERKTLSMISILSFSFFVLSLLPTELLVFYPVFDEGCRGSASDYSWYVLDNIAKGGLIDLFQSYHLKLWSCQPRKDLIVGTINFGIQSFTSYFVIWSLVRIFRPRLFKHEEG